MGYLLGMRGLLLTALLLLSGCDWLRGCVTGDWPQDYRSSSETEADAEQDTGGAIWPDGVPFIDGPDARHSPIPIALRLVAEGFEGPTDIQFIPGSSSMAVVLEKEGRVLWGSMTTGKFEELLRIQVATRFEQGLLGAAFHPDFATNGLLFLNHSEPKVGGESVSVVSRYRVLDAPRRAKKLGEILRLEQPLATHNAGQLAFGPDGMLYIGWGDGGWSGSRLHGRAVRVDPEGHGQNPQTWHGSLLRIDVDRQDPGKGYAVPPDNPWVDTPGAAPEAWAIGFRNPWRYSFAPDGRLVVADVGQDTSEEVAIVARGENHGWSIREGYDCLESSEDCASEGLTPPVFQYGRAAGASITGGFVYTGKAVPALSGRYVFADFVTGRMWTIILPPPGGTEARDLRPLGRWTMLPSTFGQDADGEIYVADHGKGRIYRISSPDPPSE